MLLSSFQPLIDQRSRVLVLGSMPGVESLARGEYYAYPRNLFWRLMQDLLGVDAQAPYERRTEALLANGIGLWDVLQHAERAGSLDKDIVRASETPNDFAALLADYPALRAFAFNGQKAGSVFDRRVHLPATIPLVRLPLPSTSPANASVRYADKLAAWRVLLDYVA